MEIGFDISTRCSLSDGPAALSGHDRLAFWGCIGTQTTMPF